MTAVLPQTAADHYRRQQRLAAATVAAARRAWARMGEDFDRSWLDVGARLLVVTTAAQIASARGSAAYVGEALEETGQPNQPSAQVNPRAFAGAAADGRPLNGLLFGAVTEAKAGAAAGLAAPLALQRAGRWLDMVTQTVVADAGRQAAGVGIAVRPGTGWVRMVNPPCCGRCAVLAGKWFRYNQGFQRHPRCFPAGVVVSGPLSLATTRRWYQGELVVITTASGKELPTTGNHPVLTDRGWLPAHLLQEGDHVVGSRLAQGARSLVVPDEHEVPARIENVWRARAVVPLLQVPTSAEDFHGDGGDGEVDVVLADRLLRHRCEPPSLEPAAEPAFACGAEGTSALAALGLTAEQLVRRAGAANGSMSCIGLGGALLGRHLCGSGPAGVAHAADRYTLFDEALSDGAAADAVAEAEAVLALAAGVRRRDVGARQNLGAARWDAPAGPLTVESCSAYAARGEDLRLRLTSQVELDRAVEVRRVEWSGHVFNLTSAEGWYDANGIIVSNCDCTHIPAIEDRAGDFRTDPQALARSGRITDLTEAEQRAIGDGADLSQLVNARRGRSGLRGMTTTEGATRRGLAGQRLGAGRGQRAVRLTPEGIYAQAGSHAEALDLLHQHGYLL